MAFEFTALRARVIAGDKSTFSISMLMGLGWSCWGGVGSEEEEEEEGGEEEEGRNGGFSSSVSMEEMMLLPILVGSWWEFKGAGSRDHVGVGSRWCRLFEWTIIGEEGSW